MLSSIQNNSIILIDEIENFLHPNLIISLISSLSDLLISTNSICLIATHSLYVAREIPRSGVHIFERILIIQFTLSILILKLMVRTFKS
ncbi:AAA family ATPase [Klebsiella pneumoniae]|uniref:AAA family ATPase n=1 Tax=Klebsiella pneumoniae TaxID=573 RepID=UPI0035183C62